MPVSVTNGHQNDVAFKNLHKKWSLRIVRDYLKNDTSY